jgi:hypothetical protein
MKNWTMVLIAGALSACAASPSSEEAVEHDETVGVAQSELYRDPGGFVCPSPKPTCVDPNPEPLGQLCYLRVYCDYATRQWYCTRTCVPIDDFELTSSP